MANWLATTPLGSIFKTFLAVMIAAAVADAGTTGSISLGKWQTYLIAGAVSVLPALINWLNPADARYGNGAA